MPESQTTGLLGAASLDALLAGLIDYAGLFPPAALDMRSSVENYAKYLAGPFARALGRFVLPVSRFAEFEEAFAHVQPVEAWGISALLSANHEADMLAIDRFNERHVQAAYVDVVEVKAASADEIAHIRAFVRGTITPYFEIPATNPEELIRTIGHIRGRAKIRTGGVTKEAIPASETIADFILQCATYDVAFKATAGLHHPIRCTKPLTYQPDAPTGVMHGFLNVFVAAIAAWASGRTRDQETVRRILEMVAPFDFRDDGVHQPAIIPKTVIEQARQHFAISFGSCSFEEPIADLKALNLL